MKVQVVIGGEAYEVEVEDTGDDSAQPAPPQGIQSIVMPSPGLEDSGDPRIYRSPVAGLVSRINVRPGQEVQTNEMLMVLEAMKMETSVMAAAAGKVKSVHVAPGEAVKVGQVLLEFEQLELA